MYCGDAIAIGICQSLVNITSCVISLGFFYKHPERALEAEEAYLTALSYKPDHVNANTNMAHLCRLQGRWQEARNYFKTALQRRPKLPTLHYYMGVVSEELGTAQDLEVTISG